MRVEMIFPPAWRSWLNWHWGRGYPSGGMEMEHMMSTAVPPPAGVSVGEQQELMDTAWLILKKHKAVADVTTYELGRELAYALTELRDRQTGQKWAVDA